MCTTRRRLFFSGVGQAVGGDDDKAAVGQDLAAFFDIGAGKADHQGDLHLHLFDRLDDTLGDPVAAVDTGKDVDQNGFDSFIRKHQIKRLGDTLGAGAAADIEEVGGFTTGMFDHVHGRHRQTGAVDDAADVAVEPDVTQATVGGVTLALVFL